jgi:hypothetical protein
MPDALRATPAAMRREDDRRLGALEQAVAVLHVQSTAQSQGIGEIKALVERSNTKLDRMSERLASEHADPAATAAGRQVLEFIKLQRDSVVVNASRIDSLESFRDEQRGAMALLRVIVAVSAVLSALAVIYSVGHAAALW